MALEDTGVHLQEELHIKREVYEGTRPLPAPGLSLTRSEEHSRTTNLQGTLRSTR